MNQANPSKVNLSELERDPKFRRQYLHYLQLANTYLVQIFRQTFNSAKRKKQLYEWLTETQNTGWTQGKINTVFFNNIVPGKGGSRGYMDAYNADFGVLLERLCAHDSTLPGAGVRFFHNLRFLHAIPRDPVSFVGDIDAMRIKRNGLKEFEKKGPGNTGDDHAVMYALGLLLLPKLHQHFLGAVNSANARAKRKRASMYADPVAVRTRFSQARKDRIGSTEELFGRRKKGRIGRKTRRDQEQAKQVFITRYQQLYPDGGWPRYNFHQFRIRHAFIGENNLRRIGKLVDLPPGKIHFSRDIEPVYNTAMAINNVLDGVFWQFAEFDKQSIANLQENGTSNKKAITQIKQDGCLNADLRSLRNHVAHNGLFCFFSESRYAPLPAEQVFERVFSGFIRSKSADPSAGMHEITQQIIALLAKEDVDWVFPREVTVGNPCPPPMVIRRWGQAEREKYLDFNRYRVDRRQNVRKVFSRWANAVKTARNRTLAQIQSVQPSIEREKH
jgi:hypothetical protein